MKIQVKDFMASPVASAVATDTVREVKDLMNSKGIHAVPIVEMSKALPEPEVKIVGIVSATDLTDDVEDSTRIEEVMTSKIFVLHQDTSAKSAAKMMLRKNVHHLVVMHDGKIVGMVSSLDFVKLVAEHTLD